MTVETGYTGSPKLQPGALIQLNRDVVGIIPHITLFQYNPETISHNFEIHGGDSIDRLNGLEDPVTQAFPPNESYSFTLELDATDDLEKGRQMTQTFGVSDRLAALERLIYSPRGILGDFADSFVGLFNDATSGVPSRQTVPIVLLALGRRRVLPVWITSLSITETLHSPAMMPIHAEVSLSFRVIQPHELKDQYIVPKADTVLAIAAYELARLQRDTLGLAHIATVISDLGDYV
ncbi:hypothetical protein [Nannocystis sp. SCPEA4]|uniref:hypothetical protein n=1 Tax=Nannocystis sp. SCPEA4 TaxID=2996787 RepID=UPI00226F40BB|nr:hypothetical protein [Nannocystis sp. SCPEA4]MCY1061715.1 hypothetical protein [Nannocystis sp. SCPEA4]